MLQIRFIVLCFCFGIGIISAQTNVFQWKDVQTLIVNDRMSEQTYQWQDGVLSLVEVKSLHSSVAEKIPFPIATRTAIEKPLQTQHNIHRKPATERTSAYWQLDLHSIYDKYEILQTLRVYDYTAGIEWRFSVKGDNSQFATVTTTDKDLVEDPTLLNGKVPYYFAIPLSNPHFTTKIVTFHEATDHHSNIANIRKELPYRKPQYYKGSMLIAQDNATSNTHLIVKLAPLQEAQTMYTGYDFSTDFSAIKVHSLGIDTLADKNKWQEAYTIFSLMYASDEEMALNAYKKYELSVHHYLPEKDNTFTMNTWGDRNRDSRISETFILSELDVAARLGITHYQIDDGWQKGLSSNSATKAGNLRWNDWTKADWEVNSERFPKGLEKVKKKATSLGIELGLWFNPSKNNDYIAWERDRDIMLDLHRKHGISWIKIDGLHIGNKQAENRVSQMLQQANHLSGGQLQFNIDVTAGKRGGYFFLNRLGNIFLENRYTDWGNYYPHLTLRNVWTLAKYVPIQRFQIEWLNKWRNESKYPTSDPLKPQNISFDYQFAITMMGQPLAWMEATGLPKEAFAITPLIQSWKKQRSQMQSGIIHSIGEEPNGYHFTGLVSYTDSKTYVLLFRENTSTTDYSFVLPFGNFKEKKFVKIAGKGSILETTNTTIKAHFTEPFQFLWGYYE
ncbi:MAG: alpha-galactosidase [Capnocytophaga sp.]|nr:alpha-galactosidase [Capnocytophaga sp.]